MPVTVHNHEEIKNATLVMEEHAFIDCKVINCHLFYSGKTVYMQRSTFRDCSWSFRDEAKNTVELLEDLGLLQRPPTTQ